MLEQTEGFTEESKEMVTWKTLAALTGFPEDLIKSELLGDEDAAGDISLDGLRDLMLSYLDKANIE